jgi:hypothetical protein
MAFGLLFLESQALSYVEYRVVEKSWANATEPSCCAMKYENLLCWLLGSYWPNKKLFDIVIAIQKA